MCKENPTLLNGMELRGRSVLFDRDQFAIGYRTFVYRDARYAAARTDPRPFGPASAANRLATASDVALARQVLEHSAQACRNPACCTLAHDNAALRRRVRRLAARLRAVDPTAGSRRRRSGASGSSSGGSGSSSSSGSESDWGEGRDYGDGGDSDAGEPGMRDSDGDGEERGGGAAAVPAAAATTAGARAKPFGLDEAPLLLKVLGQTAVPFGMEQLTLSSLGFPETKRESTPPPQPPPPPQIEPQQPEQEQPQPLPELDIAPVGSGGGVPFVPTDALLALLDAGQRAVRAELDRQRHTRPPCGVCITPFHSSVLARAAATGGLAFTPYVYREPHDLLAPPPAPVPVPVPAAPASASAAPVPPPPPPTQPPQPQQQQPPPPPPPAEPPRGWLPIKPSHITAEHFTTGIPLPRPVTSTKLVDCKDFILSACHNVCALSPILSHTSHVSRLLQQPTCAYRHCNSARQQWHLRRGGGACFDWLRGLCTNENCRFVHFPPAAVLAIVPTHL